MKLKTKEREILNQPYDPNKSIYENDKTLQKDQNIIKPKTATKLIKRNSKLAGQIGRIILTTAIIASALLKNVSIATTSSIISVLETIGIAGVLSIATISSKKLFSKISEIGTKHFINSKKNKLNLFKKQLESHTKTKIENGHDMYITKDITYEHKNSNGIITQKNKKAYLKSLENCVKTTSLTTYFTLNEDGTLCPLPFKIPTIKEIRKLNKDALTSLTEKLATLQGKKIVGVRFNERTTKNNLKTQKEQLVNAEVENNNLTLRDADIIPDEIIERELSEINAEVQKRYTKKIRR